MQLLGRVLPQPADPGVEAAGSLVAGLTVSLHTVRKGRSPDGGVTAWLDPREKSRRDRLRAWGVTTFYLLPGSDGSTRIWDGTARLLAARGDLGIPVRLGGDGRVGVVPGLRRQVELVEVALRAARPAAVLVGYSYSGLVASAVARRAVATLAGVVFLDAIVPEIASSAQELLGIVPSVVRCLVGEDGSLLYAPSAASPVTTAYIRCAARPNKSLYCVIDSSAERARLLGWAYSELPAGHRPMLEAPDELVAGLTRAVEAVGGARDADAAATGAQHTEGNGC